MGIPAALVFTASVLTSQPQLPPPQPPPPNDVICSLASVNVVSKIIPSGKGPPHCSISADLHVRAPDGVKAAARHAMITEVLDENGKDILVEHRHDPLRTDEERRELCYNLCNDLQSANNEPMGSAFADLAAVPGTIASFSGELDAFVARKVAREKVELKVSEEPIELVPGLKFLLTSVEPGENTTRISFEVHTKRRRDKADGEAGLEPVFAGLIALQADGTPHQTYNNGSDFDTRDEHIMIVKDQDVNTQDIAGWELCALDQIEKVRLTFCTKRLKIAEEGR